MSVKSRNTPYPFFKGAIFDLDGTLLDTLEDIADAANSVLNDLSYPTHPVESYKYHVGDGVKTLMERVLPENARDQVNVKTCLNAMKERYLKFLNQKATPYPPVAELLDFLKKQRCKLGVLSNKPHHLTLRCIDDFFPDREFEPVLGLREGHMAKPDPSGALEIAKQWKLKPVEIVYFGDTSTDMKTAVNAGFYAIGVLWGFRTKKELIDSGADMVIADASDFFDTFNPSRELAH